MKDEHGGIETVVKDDKEYGARKGLQLELAKGYFFNGVEYWSNTEYDLAMEEFEKVMEIREDFVGKNDESTAKALLWVGSIHWHRQEYEKAMDHFCRCFRVRMELTGSKQYCGIVTDWIDKVLEMQKVEDQDLYWRKFMSCIEHERRGDKLLREQRYDFAVEEYRTALQFEFRRRGLSWNTPSRPLVDAADLYFKIGQAYFEQQQYPRAMLEFRQALSIYIAKFGRHQRYTVETYEKIAEVSHLMGYREEFIDEYIEVVYESIRHEKIADMLMNQQKNKEALEEYMKALEIEEAGVGKLQVQCALIYLKVAKVYARFGDKGLSLKFCCKALGIFDWALGSHHRNTITAMKIIKAITSSEDIQETR